jgi:chromosome segregation ATPase
MDTNDINERLQRAEERALAAELLITEIDEERRSFTGAAGCEDRDGAVERLIKAGPNLTAAREVMRKAEECDARIKQNETQIRIHMQNTREWKEALDAIRAERDELAALLENLFTELLDDADYVAKVIGDSDNAEYPPDIMRRTVAEFRAMLPATALADLKARIKREVLEEAADTVLEKLNELPVSTPWQIESTLREIAAELRRMAEEGK